MMPFRAVAIAALLLLLAPQARAYVLLQGPMPILASGTPAPPVRQDGFAPAPRPNLDISAPKRRNSNQAEISPGLINRTANRGAIQNGFAAGSSYSDELARHGRQATALGSTLAPAITIRQPLQ